MFRGPDLSKSCTSGDQATDSLQQINQKEINQICRMWESDLSMEKEKASNIDSSTPLAAKPILDREIEMLLSSFSRNGSIKRHLFFLFFFFFEDYQVLRGEADSQQHQNLMWFSWKALWCTGNATSPLLGPSVIIWGKQSDFLTIDLPVGLGQCGLMVFSKRLPVVFKNWQIIELFVAACEPGGCGTSAAMEERWCQREWK